MIGGRGWCSWVVLIQNNQSGNHARHPAAERKEKDNEHRAAATVVHRERGEEDG